MSDRWYVGVDVGGTTIKMAFLTTAGEIVDKWEIPTNKQDGGALITTNIADALDKRLSGHHKSKSDLIGIGLGAPGFIEMDTGFIYHAVNIGWRDFPLKDKLEEETKLPVIVDNDANIAALGEMWKGAGDGAKNMLLITLGTGVGGGIVANGNILHGVNGMAGEIGHITVIPEGGAPCNCGKTGCLETVASATGIARIATEGVTEHKESRLALDYDKHGVLTAKDVFSAADASDAFALSVVDHIAYYLGFAIANLANALNPEKIVIGGGVSKAGDTLLKPIKQHFEAYALPRVADGAEFRIATLGNDAGVIGGGWLVKQQENSMEKGNETA
ncbi:ROK family glucokinase [Halalkalibacterium halodurans]|jgi:glucokinase|uniref:Glucokinase n=1 Tax=Halalkalibacterium halodurans TaxID=86665 RepID=A0A0M0KL50_ALKHA|nr:ROK family glucokinase [Halalkalibacterium halodurans]MED3647506.1 ROK family glucokinase [Halalkalibacterium halodurans]MED4161559.1 ROK family glucokinase [Halalkalibacterium halodurans]TPE69294.1 ROK family glucokinase [Halalkalibacterium halodurans]